MASARQKKWLQSIRKNIARASCQRASNASNANASRDEEGTEEFIIPISTASGRNNPWLVEEEEIGPRTGMRKPHADFSHRENAAIRIQACFRGHLARRAFQALRGLVKLQAHARGAYVRKQAQAATKCMQALVRLQARMRARHLRLRSEDGGPMKFLEM